MGEISWTVDYDGLNCVINVLIIKVRFIRHRTKTFNDENLSETGNLKHFNTRLNVDLNSSSEVHILR